MNSILRAVLHTAVVLGVCASAYSQNVDASKTIPGGLKPEQTPQFVCIGFDDNIEKDGITWIVSYLKNKKNPAGNSNQATFDGTPTRLSFYFNTNNGNSISALKTDVLEAYNDGHEIGDHTVTHSTSTSTDKNTWLSEIKNCRSDLKNIGIAEDKIIGFRTPYLEYNDNTFSALSELNFVYDCSIECGYDTDMDGTNFLWPYTLHNGSPDAENVKQHPGLWEMPCYLAIVPPDLRAQIKKKQSKFEEKEGKWTGLDWNLLCQTAEDGLAMNKDEYLATLKYSLDQRLKGNRAPMLFGAHTQFYCQAGISSLNPPNMTVATMRAAIEEFITYALTIPDVRIVTTKDILSWVKNPVPLRPTGIMSKVRPSVTPAKVVECRSMGLSIAVVKEGDYMVSILSAQGRTIVSLPGNYLTVGNHRFSWNETALPTGAYIVSIVGRDHHVTRQPVIIR